MLINRDEAIKLVEDRFAMVPELTLEAAVAAAVALPDALRALPTVSDGWEDIVEPVARRLCERQIRHVRRHDTAKEWLDANMEECVDYSWQDHIPEARTALEVVFGPLPAPPTIE